MDSTFAGWRDTGLVWLPERGMGYYPVREAPYDAAYFEKYERYAETDRGAAITDTRLALVQRYAPYLSLVDVGIGSGQFVEARRVWAAATWGYDVNPAGVAWLKDRGWWRDPHADPVDVLTFWDVLEHIEDPGPLLAQACSYVFVSLPIFDGPDHVLRSRHYRKDEHCWYWTRGGFLAWMAEHDFECVEHATPESLLGREDIHTFAFRRATCP